MQADALHVTGVRVTALPRLSARHLVAPTRLGRLPFPLSGTDGVPFGLARGAIFRGLRDLGLAGAVIALPAYHHGVEVEAVRAAGAVVRYYRVDRSLRVDLDDLLHVLEANAARAVYLIHYAGFAQPIDELAALCRARGVVLVEDCALSLLARFPDGRPIGSVGDMAVFCLYKSLPVPDGGVLVLKRRIAAAPPPAPPFGSTLTLVAASIIDRWACKAAPIERASRRLRRLTRTYRERFAESSAAPNSQHLRPAHLTLGMSALSTRVLGSLPYDQIVARRRRNYRRMLEHLGDERASATGPLLAGTCPLFFPLRVGDRDRALALFTEHGVDAIDFWRTGDPLATAHAYPDAADLRRHVIEVPIHQDVDDETLDHIASVAKRALHDAR